MRYHVIYSVFCIIMYLARGKGDLFSIHDRKNQFEFHNQDFPFPEYSKTMLKNLTKHQEKISSSEYAESNFENHFRTRYSGRKNPKIQEVYPKIKRPNGKEENFVGSDINLERFNKDSNFSLISARDILPNISLLESNPHEFYEKYTTLKIENGNHEAYKLRRKTLIESRDQNFESKKNQQLEDLVPEYNLETTLTLMDPKNIRRKRETSYASKPRSRKRRYRSRTRKKIRKNPSRFVRNKIIRLTRDQEAQNSTEKETSNQNPQNVLSDPKYEELTSRSNNQSSLDKVLHLQQDEDLMNNPQPAWQVQEPTSPVVEDQGQDQGQENPENSRNTFNRNQEESYQNSYPIGSDNLGNQVPLLEDVAPSFPSQDNVSSNSSGQFQVQDTSNILDPNLAADSGTNLISTGNNYQLENYQNQTFQDVNYIPDLEPQNLENSAPVLQNSPSVSVLGNVDPLENSNTGISNSNLRNNNPNLIDQDTFNGINNNNNNPLFPISNYNIPLQQLLLQQRGQRSFTPFIQVPMISNNFQKNLQTQKYKRGFQLVPISQNLYVLKEDFDKSQPGGSKLIVVPKSSDYGGQLVNNGQSEEKINNLDKTSAMLSFKAHLHHKVRDIGKRFLPGSSGNNLNQFNDENLNQFNDQNLNQFPDQNQNLDQPNNNLDANNLYGINEALSGINSNPLDLSNGLSYINPYSSELSDNAPLLNPSYNIPDPSNNFMNPLLENANLYNGGTLTNPNFLNSPNYFNQPMNQNIRNLQRPSFQKSYIGNIYGNSFPNSNDFSIPPGQNDLVVPPVPLSSNNFIEHKDRLQREDGSRESPFRLKYLDNYSKALSGGIYDAVNSFENSEKQEVLGNSTGSSSDPQLGKVSQTENSNQLKSSISGLNDDADGSEENESYQSDLFEYPLPYYIPQKFLSSKNREEASVSGAVVPSTVVPGNVVSNGVLPNGVVSTGVVPSSPVPDGTKKKSFSTVIEPLSDQLEKLLSTIKKVNKNLSSKDKDQEALQDYDDELDDTPRKERIPRRVKRDLIAGDDKSADVTSTGATSSSEEAKTTVDKSSHAISTDHKSTNNISDMREVISMIPEVNETHWSPSDLRFGPSTSVTSNQTESKERSFNLKLSFSNGKNCLDVDHELSSSSSSIFDDVTQLKMQKKNVFLSPNIRNSSIAEVNNIFQDKPLMKSSILNFDDFFNHNLDSKIGKSSEKENITSGDVIKIPQPLNINDSNFFSEIENLAQDSNRLSKDQVSTEENHLRDHHPKLFTKVIRKRSNPEYKPDSENNHDGDNHQIDNNEAKEDYRRKIALPNFAPVAGASGPGQVEHQPRRMDQENNKPEDIGDLSAIFGPRNLKEKETEIRHFKKKNQKSKVNSNIKEKKLNDHARNTANNIKEIKFVLNQETSNQVYEPIKNVNVKHNEPRKHILPENFSKGGFKLIKKKSDLSSKHSKNNKNKHIKEMKTKAKLSTSDMKIKSSKKGKKHSKGKRQPRKGKKTENKNRGKHQLKKTERKIPIKKQVYFKGNYHNENKDFSNKVKMSRLQDSLKHEDRSDEGKYDKPGYVRLGRKLQSLSGLNEFKTEYGKMRLGKKKPKENSSTKNKPETSLSTFPDETTESDNTEESLITDSSLDQITAYQDMTTSPSTESSAESSSAESPSTELPSTESSSTESPSIESLSTESPSTESPSTDESDYKDDIEYYTDEDMLTTEQYSDYYEDEEYEDEEEGVSDSWTYLTDYEDIVTSTQKMNSSTMKQVEETSKVPQTTKQVITSSAEVSTTAKMETTSTVSEEETTTLGTTEISSEETTETTTKTTTEAITETTTEAITKSMTEVRVEATTELETKTTIEVTTREIAEVITSEIVETVTAPKTTVVKEVKPSTKVDKATSTEFTLPVAYTTEEMTRTTEEVTTSNTTPFIKIDSTIVPEETSFESSTSEPVATSEMIESTRIEDYGEETSKEETTLKSTDVTLTSEAKGSSETTERTTGIVKETTPVVEVHGTKATEGSTILFTTEKISSEALITEGVAETEAAKETSSSIEGTSEALEETSETNETKEETSQTLEKTTEVIEGTSSTVEETSETAEETLEVVEEQEITEETTEASKVTFVSGEKTLETVEGTTEGTEETSEATKATKVLEVTSESSEEKTDVKVTSSSVEETSESVKETTKDTEEETNEDTKVTSESSEETTDVKVTSSSVEETSEFVKETTKDTEEETNEDTKVTSSSGEEMSKAVDETSEVIEETSTAEKEVSDILEQTSEVATTEVEQLSSSVEETSKNEEEISEGETEEETSSAIIATSESTVGWSETSNVLESATEELTTPEVLTQITEELTSEATETTDYTELTASSISSISEETISSGLPENTETVTSEAEEVTSTEVESTSEETKETSNEVVENTTEAVEAKTSSTELATGTTTRTTKAELETSTSGISEETIKESAEVLETTVSFQTAGTTEELMSSSEESLSTVTPETGTISETETTESSISFQIKKSTGPEGSDEVESATKMVISGGLGGESLTKIRSTSEGETTVTLEPTTTAPETTVPEKSTLISHENTGTTEEIKSEFTTEISEPEVTETSISSKVEDTTEKGANSEFTTASTTETTIETTTKPKTKLTTAVGEAGETITLAETIVAESTESTRASDTENEATKKTDATTQGTIIVEITEETTEPGVGSVSTLTTVFESESSASENTTKTSEGTSVILEGSSTEKITTLSLESSTKHAEETEEPKVETSSKSEESEEECKTSDNYDEEAAQEAEGMKEFFEYEEGVSTTNEQPKVSNTTKQTTEFETHLGTEKNKSEEISSSQNTVEETVTPELGAESSSTKLSSESISDSAVKTTSMSSLTLESSVSGLTSESSSTVAILSKTFSTLKPTTSGIVTSLETEEKTTVEESTVYSETSSGSKTSAKGTSVLEETTSAMHETSILTEVTSGVTFGSTTAKEESKTKIEETVTSLTEVTSVESSTLSDKDQEEKEKKKKIEEEKEKEKKKEEESTEISSKTTTSSSISSIEASIPNIESSMPTTAAFLVTTKASDKKITSKISTTETYIPTTIYTKTSSIETTPFITTLSAVDLEEQKKEKEVEEELKKTEKELDKKEKELVETEKKIKEKEEDLRLDQEKIKEEEERRKLEEIEEKQKELEEKESELEEREKEVEKEKEELESSTVNESPSEEEKEEEDEEGRRMKEKEEETKEEIGEEAEEKEEGKKEEEDEKIKEEEEGGKEKQKEEEEGGEEKQREEEEEQANEEDEEDEREREEEEEQKEKEEEEREKEEEQKKEKEEEEREKKRKKGHKKEKQGEEKTDEDYNERYVFDKEEEVWKQVRPDGLDQEIDRNQIDNEKCSRRSKTSSPEKDLNLVTEKVCLNVLKDSKSKEVLTNKGKDFVTKVVCLPLVPKELSSRKTAKRLARKLMTLSDNSSDEVNNLRVMNRNLNSNSRIIIPSLKLKDHEKRSEEPYTPLNLSAELEIMKRSGGEDSTLKTRQWVVDENGNRVETTDVDRLENHEWTEGPTQKPIDVDNMDHGCFSERKKRNFSWKKFWNCLKQSSETTTAKRVLVLEQKESNFWPSQLEHNCEIETTLKNNICTSEGYAPTESTILPPTESATNMIPEKVYPIENKNRNKDVEKEKEEKTPEKKYPNEDEDDDEESGDLGDDEEEKSVEDEESVTLKTDEPKEEKDEDISEDYEIEYGDMEAPEVEDEDNEEEEEEDEDEEPENENRDFVDYEVEEEESTTHKTDKTKAQEVEETTSQETTSGETTKGEENSKEKTSEEITTGETTSVEQNPKEKTSEEITSTEIVQTTSEEIKSEETTSVTEKSKEKTSEERTSTEKSVQTTSEEITSGETTSVTENSKETTPEERTSTEKTVETTSEEVTSGEATSVEENPKEKTSEEITSAEITSTVQTTSELPLTKINDEEVVKETTSKGEEKETIGTTPGEGANNEENGEENIDYGEVEYITLKLDGEEEEDEGYDEEYEEDEEEPESWSYHEVDEEETKEEAEEKTETTVKEEKTPEAPTETSDLEKGENPLKESKKEEHLRDKEVELIGTIEHLKHKQDSLKEGILREGRHLKSNKKTVPKTSSVKRVSKFFKKPKRKRKERSTKNGYKKKMHSRFKGGIEETQIEEPKNFNPEDNASNFKDASFNEENNDLESTIGLKYRKPPGPQWPTERPERYHLGGTRVWDKEYNVNPYLNCSAKKKMMNTKILRRRSSEAEDLTISKKNETSGTFTTLQIDVQNNLLQKVELTSDYNYEDETDLSTKNFNSSTSESISSKIIEMSSSSAILSKTSTTSSMISSELYSAALSETPSTISSAASSENFSTTSSVISPITFSTDQLIYQQQISPIGFPQPYFVCLPGINTNLCLNTSGDSGDGSNLDLHNLKIVQPIVKNDKSYNLIHATGGLNKKKKREVLRLKSGKEKEEMRNVLKEPRINYDFDYEEENQENHENDYEDLSDDEGLGRSLLTFKKVQKLNLHGNKKGDQDKKIHKKEKDHKNHKNKKKQQKGKSLSIKKNPQIRKGHQNRNQLKIKKVPSQKNKISSESRKFTKSERVMSGKNDAPEKKKKSNMKKKIDQKKGKVHEKKNSVIERAELAGPASISPKKKSKIEEDFNKINKSQPEEIREEETEQLLDKVLKMINQQNEENLKESVSFKKQNVTEKKNRLSRSIIDKVKDVIGHAIGYSKIPEQTRKPKIKPKKRRKKIKPISAHSPQISSRRKSSSVKSKTPKKTKNSNSKPSKNNFNSINIRKDYRNKGSFQSSINDKSNFEFSSPDNDQQKKIVFKNKSHFLNLKNIIPKVKELIEKKNLGNVEKIIVYVDKDEMKKGSSLDSNSQIIKSDHDNLQKIMHGNLFRKKNSVNRKSLEESPISINDASLERIVSLVADRVMKSINSSNPSDSSSIDSKIFVKVVQPVANGTEIPHEETKTEFTVDLFNFANIYKSYPEEDESFGNGFLVEHHENQLKTPIHRKSKNLRFGKKRSLNSDRLIKHKNRRKMNLPMKPFKRRRFWFEKMKKDEELDKKSLTQIRKDMMKELNGKFKEIEARRYNQNREEIIRDKRKISNKNLKNIKKMKSQDHNSTKSNINEKIKIIYALHHQKKNHLHTKLEETKRNTELKKKNSGRKKFSNKLGVDSKKRSSNSTLGIFNLGKEVQEKMLKKKRTIQEFSENYGEASDSQDSGIEEDFFSNREFQRPKLQSNNLNYFVENDENMFGIEDYDQEAKEFVFHHNNVTDVGNSSNINFQNGTRKIKSKREIIDLQKQLLRKSRGKELEEIQKPDQEIENLAEKILNFARKVGENRKKNQKIRDIRGFDGIVDEFGENELGLTDKNDRKALRALIDEIVNVEKNVNTTLQIIRNKLDQSGGCSSNFENCSSSKNNLVLKKENNSFDIKVWAADQLKRILNKIGKEQKKEDVQIQKAKNEIQEALHDLVNNSNDAKNLISRGKNINLYSNVVKNHPVSKFKTSNTQASKHPKKETLGKKTLKATKGKSATIKHPKNDKTHKEKKIHKKDEKKNKKSQTTKSSAKNPTQKTKRSDNKNLRIKKNLDEIPNYEDELNQDIFGEKLDIKDELVGFGKPQPFLNSRFKKEVQNIENVRNFLEKEDKSENVNLNKIMKYKSRRVQSINEDQSMNINEKPQDFQKLLIGRQLCNDKSSNTNKNTQKAKVKKKKQKKRPKNTKGSKNVKHDSKKKIKSKSDNKKIKKASSNPKIKKMNSKSEESENINSNETRNSKNEKYQTIVPIKDGRIRVKYIFRDEKSNLEKNREIREVDFRGDKNDENTRGINCQNCICDLNQAVLDLRNMLGKRNNLLGKIKTYQCNLYIDIGNEILIKNGPIDFIGQLRRDFEETRGLKYVGSGKVENFLKRGIIDVHEHQVFSLPGFNLNLPCNHEGEDITWMMSISRPNYTWIREDGSPISGVIRKNGNLELYDVDTKDSGNYSCIVNYIDPDNEEPVKNTYKHNVQVVTLPRYALRGGNRYKLEVCDDTEIEAILTYLPKKINEILCKNDICEAYIFTPHCHRQQIAINLLVVPSNIAKLVPVGLNLCGIRCRKAVQDKIALLLSRNVRAVLRRSIVFRLPHHREKLVSVKFSKRKRRRKRGPNSKFKSVESIGGVGLLIGCPAGYNLRDTHCLPCLPGFYSEDGSSHCKKCPLGTHQPNTGARTCRACTNPFVEGCHEMIWNSSAIIIILAIIFIVIPALSMVVWIVKRAWRIRNSDTCARSTEFESKQNEDRTKNPLLRFKKKRKQNDDRDVILLRNEAKKKRDRPERKTDKSGYVLVSCVDSYRSHQGYAENNSTRKSSRYKPPVPDPDFDR